MIRTQDELWCPAAALEKPEARIPPLTEEFAGNRSEQDKWEGGLYAGYNKLYYKHELLLECWEREQKKRAGK